MESSDPLDTHFLSRMRGVFGGGGYASSRSVSKECRGGNRGGSGRISLGSWSVSPEKMLCEILGLLVSGSAQELLSSGCIHLVFRPLVFGVEDTSCPWEAKAQ